MNNMHITDGVLFKLSSQAHIHTLQKYLCSKADDMIKPRVNLYRVATMET